jgi:hypothetical protein
MDKEIFLYERLQRRHIRLPNAEPSSDPSRPISCQCAHVSLDDTARAPYVTISYGWGSGDKPHQILINGHLLSIGSSVHDVLRSKRITESGRLLWIDAISINQEDKEEKSQQVGLMGEIYSSAEVVRVWLRPSFEDSGLAVGFIEMIFSALPEIETGDLERTMYYAQKYPKACPERADLLGSFHGHGSNGHGLSKKLPCLLVLRSCAEPTS